MLKAFWGVSLPAAGRSFCWLPVNTDFFWSAYMTFSEKSVNTAMVRIFTGLG
jgi:hypothetical protein